MFGKINISLSMARIEASTQLNISKAASGGETAIGNFISDVNDYNIRRSHSTLQQPEASTLPLPP
jgi:hypothetical protein